MVVLLAGHVVADHRGARVEQPSIDERARDRCGHGLRDRHQEVRRVRAHPVDVALVDDAPVRPQEHHLQGVGPLGLQLFRKFVTAVGAPSHVVDDDRRTHEVRVELADHFGRKSAPHQANRVEAVDPGAVADGFGERQRILRHDGIPADERVASHTASPNIPRSSF